MVVLVALATGIGLFVAVWALGDGGSDDAAAEEADPGTSTTTAPAPTVVDSVDALLIALGCDGSVDQAFDGALPLPGIEGSALCGRDGRAVAGIHVAADDEAMAGLLAYFDDLSGGWTPNGCPGETEEEALARARYALVAGERWVVTTSFAAVREAALAAGGEEVAFSPEVVVPASYPIAWVPCSQAPEIPPR